jgi:putative DNA primase/helicase
MTYKRNMGKDFLQNLYQNCNDGYLELRLINESGSKQKFFPITNDNFIANALDYIKDFVGKYHIFFGIQPRKKKKGTDSAVETLLSFWIDLDAKDHNNSKAQARESLNNFELEPSLLVDSGNGYHAYWELKKPWQIKNESDRKEITRISKAIHKITGGDSTFNVSRILRLPGTPNIKNPYGDGITDDEALWKECKIVSNSYQTYSIKEIKNSIPDSVETEVKSFEVDFDNPNLDCKITSISDLRKYVDSNVIQRAKNIPAKLENDRSANDYWVAIQLYEAGLNDKEVFNSFVLFKNNDYDAGHKFKKRGAEYLEQTLPKAKGESANLKLPMLMDKVRNAEGIDEKLEIAKDVYPIINYLDTGKKDAKINELQDAFGGSRVMKKSTIKKMIKKEQTKTGPGRFFTITNAGSMKFVPKLLGDYLLEKYNLLNIESYLHYYKNGVFYDKAEKRVLHDKIITLLGETWKENYRDEAIGYVQDKTYIEPSQLPDNEGIINIKNGMYDINNQELLPHSPEYKSLAQLDVKFDPDAYSDRLNTFVDEVFTEETHDLLWEHAGYSLLPNLKLKKFLILTGEGNNGKTVWSLILQEVLGSTNYSNRSIQDLSANKNARADLFGKLANIYADLPSGAIKETGTIKMLTGGDEITGERKYKDSFSFKNTAKLIFSANELPPIKDYNEAFFDRVHIINCPNIFEGKNDDPYLVSKLTTEEVKSAWLNKAIEGAKRLLDNEHFSVSKIVEDEIKNYKYSSNSVIEFLNVAVNRTKGSFEGKNELYSVYVNWCKSNGRYPVSNRKFTRRAKSKPSNMKLYHPTVRGTQIEAWKNVKLNDVASKKYTTKEFIK